MKTNKDQIQLLKSKHRLECVMQATGEVFKVDEASPDQWHSTVTPGLVVDTRRQLYDIQKQGADTEAGDVFTWLQRRFNWSFAMAIKYLKNRPADPKRETQPVRTTKAERKHNALRVESGNQQALDHWQEEALEMAGAKIRPYFLWSVSELVLYVSELRLEPVHAPGETHCGRCGERIHWKIEKSKQPVLLAGHAAFKRVHVGPIPVVAYAIKRRFDLSDLGFEIQKEIKEAFRNLDDSGALFLEETDNVICEQCAWREYDFQAALQLCIKSAWARSKAQQEHDEEIRHQARPGSEDVVDYQCDSVAGGAR
jgi:hypothetical protein